MTSLSRPIRIVLGTVLAGVIVLAAVLVWLGADGEPQSAQLVTATPVPNARLYGVVTAESALDVTVESSLGTIAGTIGMGPGTIELSRAEGGWRVTVNLTFDARTLDIGNAQLNTIMRRALEVETYPDGIFVASSRGTLSDLDSVSTIDLVGQLELHGVVQDYTIPTSVTLSGDMITLAADTVIDAGAFGVSIPSLFAKDELTTTLLVVARERDLPRGE